MIKSESRKKVTVSTVVSETFENLEIFSEEELTTYENYYHRWHKHGEAWASQSEKNYGEIYDLIASKKNPTLLDIGSGCGSEAIAFALNGAKVTGVEISQNRTEVANKRKEFFEKVYSTIPMEVSFAVTDVLRIEDKFQMVWLNHAFHHLEPREKMCRKIADLLEPGGHLILCECNGWNPAAQLAFFKKRGFKTIAYAELPSGEIIPYGDERITTATNLSRLFEPLGLCEISRRYYQALPNHRKLKKIQDLLDKVPTPPLINFKYVSVFQKTPSWA